MERAVRKSQHTKALMELRSLVLDGALAPGSRLSEVEISKRIGISRTPLREAFTRLVEEGLLERLPSGGCRVRSFSAIDILDAIELRGVIEGVAARLAAERGASKAGLDECKELILSMDRALGQDDNSIDFEQYAELNNQFHLRLARLCESPTVEREFDRITRLPLAAPSAFVHGQVTIAPVRRSMFYAQEQHRTLLQAIERREGSRAEALAREHARLAASNLEYVIGDKSTASDTIPGLALLA